MVLIVAPDHAAAAREFLAGHGETVFTIGEIRARKAGEPQTVVNR
jgi:phosphoribosylaminoimidazole (AIR) synthetase